MLLSILVVSRTPKLINKMLDSVRNSTKLEFTDVEILCSWNGEKNTQDQIINRSGYKFSIVQNIAYHFSSNVNNLARNANGDLLLIINDDIILDENSIDQAINCLLSQSNAGIIGSRLRYKNGLVQHVGIQFDIRHRPYHKLEKLIYDKQFKRSIQPTLVPSVTGALFLIKRDIFMTLLLNEDYQVCGEDIELCLDLRSKLKLDIYLCHQFSAVHISSITRKLHNQYGNLREDLLLMQRRRASFLKQAKFKDYKDELIDSREEVNYLLEINAKNKFLKRFLKKLVIFFRNL